MSQITTQEYQVASLGIKYTLETSETEKWVKMSEDDFNKIIEALRESDEHANNLHNHLIDELKKIALIRNIVISE